MGDYGQASPLDEAQPIGQGSTEPFSHLWLGNDPDAEVAAWMEDAEWHTRNPMDVKGTNESWRNRFGVDKVSVIREAAHGVPLDASWLEVGCSAGAHMRCVQAAGWKDIQGCDVNEEAIKLADNAVWADARSLPFEDDQFDAVTTSGSLMHMGPEERMIDCLHEMCRVSREWLLFIEIFHPTGTLISFKDLMPPAWVMPWERWLSAHLPDGWRGVRGRVLRGRPQADPTPLTVLLIRKT